MISGIHLATALSVMLHMEQEGEMMETKEIKVRLDNLIDDWDMLEPRSDWYDWQRDVVQASERLSEQQQVIDDLVKALEHARHEMWEFGMNEDILQPVREAISRAKENE